MGVNLYDYQIKALDKMHNGCILNGGVGSGKSRTAIAYYYERQGGDVRQENYIPMDDTIVKDLYIITTAHKRDSLEWEGDLAPFLLSTHSDINIYNNKVIVDSWNNITKYKDIKNAFFIFDEQRVVGSGTWVKTFLKITKSNEWILLSATPGDCWSDYIPVFIANGFYKNRTQFINEHVIYSRFTKYPKIDRYINTGRLIRLRNKILVDMDFKRETVPHHEKVYVTYNMCDYKTIFKKRWNPFDDRPISSASELCYLLRRVVNSSEDRQMKLLEIVDKHPKSIIFYNFDYERDILKKIFSCNGCEGNDGNCTQMMFDNCPCICEVAEWNGHAHQPVPKGDRWVYLVQYTAGCEGWNCITTDTVIFYSQNYSYKVLEQACGRIDRLNTPFKDLWYYHILSHSGIDFAISKALNKKQKFNESRWLNKRNI